MRKFFIAFMVLALMASQAMAQVGVGLSSISAPGGPVAVSATDANSVAKAAARRVCWRKVIVTPSDRLFRPAVFPSCDNDHKLFREFSIPMAPSLRGRFEALRPPHLVGRAANDLLRPPIA